MKFKSLFLMLALAGTLASCNLDTEDKDNYTNIPYSVCNLVTSVSGEQAYATKDNYTLTYYTVAGKVVVNSSKLSVAAQTSSFTSSEMPYSLTAYGEYPAYYEVTKFQGGSSSFNGMPITNLQGFTSGWLNYLPVDPANPNATSLPGYYYSPQAALVISYNVGTDYLVRTFLPDAVYGGTTTVNTVGAPLPPYIGQETLYRVVFKQDLKSADIIFYNAKFNERMPATTFIVRGLEVVYNNSGYTIRIPSGVDSIVPEMPEGEGLTPYDPYRFTTLTLTPSSADLTQALITFNIDNMVYDETLGEAQVRGSFNCTFEGAYTYSGAK